MTMKNWDLHRLLPRLSHLLLSLLFSMGLALPLLSALNLPGAGYALLAIVGTLVLLSLLFSRGIFRLLGAGLLLLSVLLCAFSGSFSQLGAMLGAALHLFEGNAHPIQVYSVQAAVFLGVIFAVVSFAIARQRDGIYSAGVLFATCLLLCWFAGGRRQLILFVPALIAMGSMLSCSAFSTPSSLKPILFSVLAAFVALGLSASFAPRSPRLEEFAENLRTYIYDTLFFTEPRTVYSIEADGFQPLDSRLGGAVDPADSPVMMVETEHTLHLRGAVKNHYTGLSWLDTLSTRRFLYSDFRYRSIRSDMLDWERPDESLRTSSLFDTYPVTVTLYANSASTLFAPARASELTTPMALVPYFNASGELFITRDLAAGDSYSFRAPLIRSDDERLPALLEQAALRAPAADRSDYLNVPDAVADDVRTLAQKLVQNCTTPLEKAQAIQTYLLHNFEYTLQPETPPDQQDFVSYFLLKGEEGYCTYFASAMAVLCRINGLPTRYVEGYLATPVEGVALVTCKDAHAWVEVWFDGFGWVTFDPTPRHDAASQTPPDSPQENSQDETPPEDSGDDAQDDASGEPPQGDDSPSQPPEEDSQDSSQEPTPPPEQEPSPTPSPTPEVTPPSPTPTPPPNDPNDPPEDSSKLWWILLIALILVALVSWRIYLTLPSRAVSACQNDSEKLLTWYRLLLGLLIVRHLPQNPAESPLAYADRIRRLIPRDVPFAQVAESVSLLGYSRQGVSASDADLARRCYKALLLSCSPFTRVKWFVHRLVHGIGSIRQIP